jgi:hypothetical protein
MKTLITLSLVLCLLAGCYRMPTDDDYNAVPLINHPDLTREKNDIMPQMGY